MRPRITPSFVVAVLALVLASGGTGYAAAKVTSKQIKDGTVQSRDVKDGTVQSRDVKDGSLTGVDLADGSISSADLLDGTITGTDVADGSLTGADVADGSLGAADLAVGAVTGATVADGSLTGADVADGSIDRRKLDDRCAGNEEAVFGGCVRRTPFGRSSHQAAVDDCNKRNGRLPTIAELKWISTHDEYTWADGNPSNYEFSGSYTTVFPFTPIGMDRAGNGVPNSSAQLFWHHCVTY